MDSPFVSMFGDTLVKKGGETSPTSSLDGKNVMIYFSAHWCGPCRGFTPLFAEWYNKAKNKDVNMEAVFVSSDNDDEAFTEYLAEMPWYAVPYANRDVKATLSKKFKVQGIPTLVVVGPDGKLITKDGRGGVMNDPTGSDFPWAPKTFADLMADDLVDGSGAAVPSSSLAGKPYGIYFSAHWCGPCRGFTPKLIETYNKIKGDGKDFEIVFASSDRDDEAFAEYFGEMPWLAFPYKDRGRVTDLKKLFEVQGIPTFIMIGADGKLLNANARSNVTGDPEGANFPWPPQPVNDLDDSADGINETPSIVVMCEKADAATKDAITATLATIGREYQDRARATEDDLEFCFFTGKLADGLTGRIRGLCDVTDVGETPLMVLLDIPDEGGFYVSDATAVDEATVRGFIAAYKEKSLERKQLLK